MACMDGHAQVFVGWGVITWRLALGRVSVEGFFPRGSYHSVGNLLVEGAFFLTVVCAELGVRCMYDRVSKDV